MVYFWGFPVTRSTTTRFDCMASWGFDDYLSEGGTRSPWLAVEGWHFKTACHDPMHVVFLGICRDLYPSTMAYWMRNNFFGTGPIKERLLQFSAQLRCDCRKEKILSIFLEVFNCLQYFVAFTSGISRLFFFWLVYKWPYFPTSVCSIKNSTLKDPANFQAIHSLQHRPWFWKQISGAGIHFQGGFREKCTLVLCQNGT